jgi:hypothetical protein
MSPASDTMPCRTIRAGVASGVGTFSWMVFLPFALRFGLISERYGAHVAGWMILAAALLASGLLIRAALGRRAADVDGVAEAVPAIRTVRPCVAQGAA